MNYTITGLVLLGVIILIIYLIRRNRKDEQEFISDMSRSELEPEKHDQTDNI